MGEVIKITPRTNIESVFEQGWICGCGCEQWILFADGKCVCAGCQKYSTRIKVVEVIASE